MTNEQILLWLMRACFLSALILGCFWAYLDIRRRTFDWRWRTIPRFKREFELLPRLQLNWGRQDLPHLDHRTLMVTVALGWLVWNRLAILLVKTPRPWTEAERFRNDPAALVNTQTKLDRAHDRRVRKASNRAIDRLRSQGVVE